MKALLVLGSNMGNRRLHLQEAMDYITGFSSISKVSGIYVTAAWGNTDQDDFYNQAVLIEFEISPDELMNKLIETERRMGRVREQKWEPRIIDLDVILIDELIIESEILKVPHPYMHSRKFVLEPLNEICPEWYHPVLKTTVSQLFEKCEDELTVTKLGS